MDYYFFLLISIFFFCLVKFFQKKLLVLLILEGLMLCVIYFYCFFHSTSIFCFLNMFIFSVFMVLDSIFGICCMISSSRNSTVFNSFFSKF